MKVLGNGEKQKAMLLTKALAVSPGIVGDLRKN